MRSSDDKDVKEVKLAIEDSVFTVDKDVLCEYSDYFKAMFSGNYVENSKDLIKIDVVDAKSMETIIQYMKIGLTDLSEFPLNSMGDLSMAANFLQIRELIKQIEYTLELKLSLANWIDIKGIAEVSSFHNLEKYATAFGLLHFDTMKPEHIPTVNKLCWYLSHPYLNADSELLVFKFGVDWVSDHKVSADALLIVLGCLNIQTLCLDDFTEMLVYINQYEGSLAAKIIELFHEVLTNTWGMTSVTLSEHRKHLCQKFTESVYNEAFAILRESRGRQLELTPCICAWKSGETATDKDGVPHHVYTFTDNMEKWLEVGPKNLWGWSIASWGPHKLVVVGGEYGRGTGNFNKEVAIYDTLKNEWTRHGVQLPPHRHSGAVIHNNQLYIIGGVGTFRVVLQSTIVYDLEQRSYRKLSTLPDTIQNPAICVHKGKVYVATHSVVYQHTETEGSDDWSNTLFINIRANYMVSLGEYIYITQSFFGHLYRFRPGIDKELDLFTYFSYPVSGLCKVGSHIMAFTQTACGQRDILAIEEYRDGKINVLWTQENGPIRVNEVAGCCALVLTMPHIEAPASQYPKKYLKRFNQTDSENA